MAPFGAISVSLTYSVTVTVSTLDDHGLAAVTAMAAILGTSAVAIAAALDDDFGPAGAVVVVMAAALDDDLLGAGNRRGRNRNRGNRRYNKSKLFHDFSL